MKPDDAAASLKQLAKLLPLAKDLHEKLGAILDDWDRVLGGGAGLAMEMKQVEHAFDETWGLRYAGGAHGRYVWRHAVDKPNIKRLIKALGCDEVIARSVRYLQSEDPFLVKNRHPFGLFVSGINGYAVAGPATEMHLEAPTVADCKHEPRCSSDQRHTQRKMQDMRAI